MTRNQRIVIAVAVPVAVLLMVIFRESLVSIVVLLGGCTFNRITGLYCPGCGNTRSMNALLHGNLILAVRNNITMPFIAFVLLALYIELICSIFNKKVHILTRKAWVWWTILVLFFIYFIVRNFIPAIAPV